MQDIYIKYDKHSLETTIILNVKIVDGEIWVNEGINVIDVADYLQFAKFIENKVPIEKWAVPLENGWGGIINELTDEECSEILNFYLDGIQEDFVEFKANCELVNKKREYPHQLIWNQASVKKDNSCSEQMNDVEEDLCEELDEVIVTEKEEEIIDFQEDNSPRIDVVEENGCEKVLILNRDINWNNLREIFLHIGPNVNVLEFFRCTIYFNFSKGRQGMSLSPNDCVIFNECKLIGGDVDEKVFLSVHDDCKVIFRSCELDNAKNLIDSNAENVRIEIIDSKLVNPKSGIWEEFININGAGCSLKIENSDCILNDYGKMRLFCAERIEIINSTFIGKEETQSTSIRSLFSADEEMTVKNSKFQHVNRCIFAEKGIIESCSFKKCEMVVSQCLEIRKCIFEQCQYIWDGFGNICLKLIENCAFFDCCDLFMGRMTDIFINRCAFICTKKAIFKHLSGAVFNKCLFGGICLESTLSRWSAIELGRPKTIFSDCIFRMNRLKNSYLIGSEIDVEGIAAHFKNCEITDAITDRTDKNIFEIDVPTGKWGKEACFSVFYYDGGSYNVMKLENVIEDNIQYGKYGDFTSGEKRILEDLKNQFILENNVGIVLS